MSIDFIIDDELDTSEEQKQRNKRRNRRWDLAWLATSRDREAAKESIPGYRRLRRLTRREKKLLNEIARGHVRSKAYGLYAASRKGSTPEARYVRQVKRG